MDIQDILQNQWEKVLLGAIGLLCLVNVGWEFVSPPPATQKSNEIVNNLDRAVAKIKKSKPSTDSTIPNYSNFLEEHYKQDLVAKELNHWVFYRKPFLWKTKYTKPTKGKFKPRFYPPEKLSASLGAGGIVLTWKQSSDNEYCTVTKSEIYRKSSSGQFEKVATVPGDETKYVDGNVGSKMTYSYYVKSYAKADPTRSDVESFRSGEGTGESNQVSMTTLPDVILEIEDFGYGEVVYNFVKDKKEQPCPWVRPGNKSSIQRLKYDANRKGKKPYVRFTVSKLDQKNKQYVDHINDFRQKIGEGEHIVVIKEGYKEGKPVTHYVDSGYKLVRLGQGHYKRNVGGNERKEQKPVVFYVKKSVNHEAVELALTAFGMQGEDKPTIHCVSKGDGEEDKKKAKAQLSSGAFSSGSGGDKNDKSGSSSSSSGGKESGKKDSGKSNSGGGGLFGN